mmetsp:Transcript_30098/g.70261  ORF Transcript_30098/g.70261 Transcript_30098/m.70261 type:complete len:1469 (+) Transcript_30098:143-4549(+)
MEGGENTSEDAAAPTSSVVVAVARDASMDASTESEVNQQQVESTSTAPEPPSSNSQKDPPEVSSPSSLSDATNSTSNASSTGSTASVSPSSSKEDDEDDVTSKAAVALAAVAAAASATHKSPAEAAAQARAHAQSFLANGDDPAGNPANHGEPQVWKRVRLKAVQRALSARAEEHPALAAVLEHVKENVGFLEYLLLLEYFQCIEEEDQGADGQRGDDPPETRETEALHDEAVMATVASERLVSVLKKLEGAYESLLNLLPTRGGSGGETQQNSSFEAADHGHPTLNSSEDYETTVAVPDLLPPCTAQGDPTLAFFRACVMADERKYSTSSVGSTGNNNDGAIENSSSRDQADAVAEAVAKSKNPSTPQNRTAVSSMFGSMFKRNAGKGTGASSILGSLRRKSVKNNNNNNEEDDATIHSEATSTASANETAGLRPGEYAVKIEREMLGLTVENVLERTVVRTVLAGGPAKKAGAKVGSLIVKVGNVETKNLTHFETIDELRQSQRPLLLVLKQLTEDSLRAAREEMGRLIRGAGYGTIMDGNSQPTKTNEHAANATAEAGDAVRPLIGADLRLDAFTTFLKRRLASTPIAKSASNSAAGTNNKKEDGIQRAGYKLIWILTLFVFGMEREVRVMSQDSVDDGETNQQPANTSHLQQHTLKEYSDSAKSAAKVLLDFTRKRIDPTGMKEKESAGDNAARGRRGGPPPPPPPMAGRGNMRRGPAANRRGMEDSSVAHEKPLLQIGDVLQRTRTFLAATTSPPAALLRGEVIALLCDILDVDTEMELSEEESASATSGRQAAGAINDLGSAGSLLKLIVLNYTIMRTPIIEESADTMSLDGDSDWTEDLRRKGSKDKQSGAELLGFHTGNRFLAVVHRLAASRSMSARITACSLGPVMWGHLDFPHQLQLRGVITRALHDVEVMVRKATANVLHEIAELVFDARCVPWLVLMSERAMTDPEPQLRSAAMTLTWHLAEHLPNAFLGDASQGSRYLRRLPDRNDPIFADVYLLQCKLLPVATRLAEDRSPSVRLAVAAQCDRLCDALGDHWSSVVIDVLLGLLSDPDERVRCEAVMCVPRLASIVLVSSPPGASVSEVSILEALVPASIRLQKDTVAVVRVALASAAGELLNLLVALQGRSDESPPDDASQESFRRYKKQVDERLIPLVQILLNDQDPEVTSASLRAVTNASRRSSSVPHSRHRHQSIASEDDSASVTSLHSHASRDNRQPVFLPVLSEIQVLRLLPTLSSLANGKQWRVRQSAVEIVPALLGCTQKLETRTEISKLCVRLMGDNVDEVRRTAAECLCMGGSSLGSHGEDASSEWFEQIVVPAIKEFSAHINSKQRLLSLKMVEIILSNGACPSKWKPSVAESSVKESPVSELISIALSLCDDRIANVRLNVGRVLETVLHLLSAEDLNSVAVRIGQQLAAEKESSNGPRDRDVIFYAARCASRAKQLMDEQASEASGAITLL